MDIELDLDLENVVGWFGCFLTACFYLTQLGPFIEIIRGKLYFEDAPSFLICSCYTNCFFWMLYGNIILSKQLKIANIISCTICLFAMIVYLIFEIRKYIIDTILNTLILITASWGAYNYFTITLQDERIIGLLCVSSSIIVYLYYCYIIYRVIKEKNYMLIKFAYITIYFISSLIWLSYGIIKKNQYIICSYSIGIIISLIQIIIYLNFEKKYPVIGKKYLTSTVGIETSENDENKKEATSIKIGEEVPSKFKVKHVKIITKLDN